jgi:hypothetical protein
MKKKNSVSKIIIAAVCVLVVCLVAFLAVELATELSQSKTGKEVTVEQMQAVIDKDFAELPATIAYGTKEIYKNMTVSVNSVEYGIERDVILNCSYSTLNVSYYITLFALRRNTKPPLAPGTLPFRTIKRFSGKTFTIFKFLTVTRSHPVCPGIF